MELEVGMYVRHKLSGYINKIVGIKEDNIIGKILCMDKYPMTYLSDDFEDLKSSYNKIDLIEVGDLVVVEDIKYQVSKITKNIIYTTKCPFEIEEIDYVVTHEQFERVSYKLGKEDN